MSIELAQAEEMALECLAKKIRIDHIANFSETAYSFDPSDWFVFSISHDVTHVGSMRYVAIHRKSGEVRDLGALGA